jgi:hypothetical protein
MTGVDIREEGVRQILSIAAHTRRFDIVNVLFQFHGGTVASGPFAGMKLMREASWGDGDLAPKLLGCYEAELHPAVAKVVARNPKTIVNIGCAEGYYAIGLARLLPQARVFAFEISEQAQDICRRAAATNQLGDQLVVAGKCDIEQLRKIAGQTDRPVLVVDCEGAELELLDPIQAPEIRHCDMIVECHDFMNPKITQTLQERLSSSHDIENVVEGPRDPNQFASLRRWQSLDRWLAVNENRPVTMNWLVCWAR